MTGYLNRVYHTTTTTGQTTSIVLSAAAISNAYLTMGQAGAIDEAEYSYVLQDGSDFEVQQNQTYDVGTGTLTRGTPVVSKISGVVGTTKMNLSGSAAVRVTPVAEDYEASQSVLDLLSTGAMLKSIYDPLNVGGSAFLSSNHRFTQAGTGATNRTVESRLRDTVNVVDFGADPTGAADSTTAINNAITRVLALGGGKVVFPAGTYKITNTITITSNNVTLQGAGIDATKINPVFASSREAFNIRGNYNGIQDLTITGDELTTARVSVGIVLYDAYRPLIDRVNVERCIIGIHLKNFTSNCYAPTLRDIRTNWGTVGLQIGDTAAGRWQSIYMYNCTFGLATSAGVLVYVCGGLQWVGGESLGCSTGMKFRPGSTQTCEAGFISSVYFDNSTADNIDMDVTQGASGGGKAREWVFTNCSFNFSQGGNGVTLVGHASPGTNISSIVFNACRFVINAKRGYYSQYVYHIEFMGCHFLGNSLSASNTYQGLDIGPGTTNVRIIGGTSGSTAGFTNNQKYGVEIHGTCWNVTIVAFDVTGNVTGGVQNNASNNFQSGFLTT